MTLDKAIGGLPTSRSRDDIRIVGIKVGLDGAAEERMHLANRPASAQKRLKAAKMWLEERFRMPKTQL